MEFNARALVVPIHHSQVTIHHLHFRLIVGLGNPGREYAATRHNVGFMILDKLAADAGVAFKAEKNWRADVASKGGVHYCKPQSYMNLSGQPVAAVSQFYKIPAGEILVVLDDVALPLGKLRVRKGGSSGGHNGLQSILDLVGNTPRLRVGIGASDGRPMTDHVLGHFHKEEKAILEETLDRAVAAIGYAQQHGAEAAMNKFN